MWNGSLDPFHAIALIERLVDDPKTRVYGIRAGNREMRGWDTDTILLARLNNLMAAWVSAHSSKNKNRDDLFVESPRPKSKEPEQPMTIAEFSSRAFSNFMYG